MEINWSYIMTSRLEDFDNFELIDGFYVGDNMGQTLATNEVQLKEWIEKRVNDYEAGTEFGYFQDENGNDIED